jgi:hypothetical protein
MARRVCSLTAVLLLASLVATSSFADQEQCVAEDQTVCPAAAVDDGAADNVVDTSALVTTPPAIDQPADTSAIATPATDTRTITPAAVVNPFADAAPQVAPSESILPGPRPDPQRLPPGPPSRYP